MTEGSLPRVILRVALPIAVTNLAQASTQLANAFFVGRLGEHAIAAVSAAGPLFFVFLALGSGLSTAGAVLVAQNTGAGRDGAASHAAAQTLLMILAVGLCFTAVGLAFSPWALRLIGVEPAVARLALRYLTVTYVGLVPMYAAIGMQSMLQSVGEARFTMRVMLGAVGLNVVLCPLLIFGFGSWQGFGIAGAAGASALAQAVACLVLVGHMASGRSQLRLCRRDFKPSFRHLRLALDIGLPASLDQASRSLGAMVMMVLAAGFGTVALASYGVGVRVMSFWFMPMIGLSVAVSAVVGQNIGAGRMDRAEQAGRVAAWMALASLSLIGLAMLPFNHAIMAVFAPGEAAVIDEAAFFALVSFPFLGIMALPSVFGGVFRGAGSTRQAMMVSMVMQYGLQIPFAWACARFTSLGVEAVFWSFPFANIGASILAWYWFVRGNWRRRLVE